MFTPRSILAGSISVFVLLVVIWVIRTFSHVGPTQVSGRGMLLVDLMVILVSPTFWIAALLIFFSIAFITGRLSLGHS